MPVIFKYICICIGLAIYSILRAMNLLLAIICVVLFSLTVPFTRMAALEATPEVVTLLRLIGAGAVCLLLALRDGWVPPRNIRPQLLATSFGAVIGFSTLMAFAMRQVPGSHGAIALAALPAVTAAYASLRDRRNPGMLFWLFAVAGTVLSFGFFFTLSTGSLMAGDALLGLAVIAGAFGYVEGGRLSRLHGGRRVMSWAILLSLPIALPLALLLFPASIFRADVFSLPGWFAVAYLALVSQSTGMFLWYRVLARGPMEKVALVQLLQPFFTLLASIYLLQETVSLAAWIIALLVAVCIFGASSAKSRTAPTGITGLDCTRVRERPDGSADITG